MPFYFTVNTQHDVMHLFVLYVKKDKRKERKMEGRKGGRKGEESRVGPLL
jgi:hypothetical protein